MGRPGMMQSNYMLSSSSHTCTDYTFFNTSTRQRQRLHLSVPSLMATGSNCNEVSNTSPVSTQPSRQQRQCGFKYTSHAKICISAQWSHMSSLSECYVRLCSSCSCRGRKFYTIPAHVKRCNTINDCHRSTSRHCTLLAVSRYFPPVQQPASCDFPPCNPLSAPPSLQPHTKMQS